MTQMINFYQFRVFTVTEPISFYVMAHDYKQAEAHMELHKSANAEWISFSLIKSFTKPSVMTEKEWYEAYMSQEKVERITK